MRPRYTDAERKLIEAQLGKRPLAEIAAQIGRTEAGVEWYLKNVRRGSADQPSRRVPASVRCARLAARAAGPTIPVLAEQLGLRPNVVRRWVEQGMLTAVTRYERRRPVAVIPRQAVRQFILSGALVDLPARPRGVWRVPAIVAERRWRERYISGPELADVLSYARQVLGWLRRTYGLPEPAVLARGVRPNYYERAAVRSWLLQHPQFITAPARLALGLTKE